MQKTNLLTILIMGVLLLVSANSYAQFSGGSGTEAEPYQIANTDDLIYLSQVTPMWNKHFIQTEDIIFNADETQVDWDDDGSPDGSGTEGFSPIGNSLKNFTGSYDGQSHIVDNLFINRSTAYYIGLFGYSGGSTIENLGVTNVNVTGNTYTGGLVGYMNSSSNLNNCYSSGTAAGVEAIGGLVGRNEGSVIENSYSTVDVEGGTNLGGLVGYDFQATIQNSYSTGHAKGESNVGGLVGYNGWQSTISNCYSSSDVIRINGSTNNNFAGFCGNTTFDTTIEYCYSTGDVFESEGTDWSSGDKAFVGYVTGSPTYTNNFFDSDASNQSSATGATGKSITDMQTQSTFTGAGWDFTSNWEMSSPVAENGYPHLQWENITTPVETSPSQVSGKYQIATLDDLRWIAEDDSRWSNDYEQTADIDANVTSGWDNGKGWTPIGNSTTNFTGTYDGQDHTINNLYINRSSENFMGLFGYILGDDDNEFISNLGLITVDITGQNIVGGIAGMKMGPMSNPSLINCYVTGQVSGEQNIGALVGENQYTIITECYSNVTIHATSKAGGLAGYIFQTTINNCYSLGDVTRSSGTETDFGGFCGHASDSDIENCYATGNVVYDGATEPTDKGFLGSVTGTNTYTANFFDSEASNQSSATGATKKTTDEMTAYTTFTDAGWDFCPSGTHSDGNWTIDESTTPPDNDGYPALFWQGLTNNYIESTPGLWTGSTSYDWNTVSNWDDGNVPTSTVDVTIPSGCSNYPSIDEAAVCQNFTIENGGEININSSYTLEVNGDFILNDGGTFSNNGNLRFSGSDCHLSDNRTSKLTLGNIQIGDNVKNNLIKTKN